MVLSSTGYAQSVSIEQLNKKQKKTFQKAKEDYQKKNYGKSQERLLKILEKHPDVIEVHAILAKSYLDNKQGQQAIKHLKFMCDKQADFDPRACYTLYKIFDKQQLYSEAKHYINRFDEFIDDKHKLKTRVHNEKKLASLRDSLFNNPSAFDPIRLGAKINSQDLEYLPAFTADENTLIFTRRLSRQEDFYEAKLDGDSIISVTEISTLNTPLDEGAHCISPDGKLIIFTACNRPDGKGNCDLYYSQKTSTGWSKSKNLGSTINTEAWESQPSLSADGKTLYFASTRGGGFGKKDIWKSNLVDRRWTQPENLGEYINTKGNEASPFIHFDNQSLYFRSDNHPGMGGFDIFYSQKKDNEFSEVINLGYPINTQGDEGALSVSLNGDYAYFSSDQDPNGDYRQLDIFKFKLPKHLRPQAVSYVKLKSVDAEHNTTLRSKVNLLALDSGDTLVSELTDIDGELLFITKPEIKYALHIDADGYLFHSEHVHFKESNIQNPIDKKVLLKKLIPEEIASDTTSNMILNNIFFEQGSATLLDESKFEINKLYDLLTNRPQLSITITGHTDNIGDESSNNKLSLDRAISVKNAIIALGIAENRIQTEGKGESEPIADNDTEEGRQKNRRTEFRIN